MASAGLWIVGAAMLLAAYSYLDWRVRVQGAARGQLIREARPAWMFAVACTLSGIALSLRTNPSLRAFLLSSAAATAVSSLVLAWKQRRA